MTVFARVATARSFSAAARQLGISQATASKHVQTLENSLGIRLLHRTTRRVALTDAGMSFYAQCTRILEDVENAWQASQTAARLGGSLRIAAPVMFGSARLAPILGDFMREYPALWLVVTLVDRPVNVVEEQYDVAIRIGADAPENPALIVHRLAPLRFAVCAAPDYLHAAGAPRTPPDLARLSCMVDSGPRAANIWRFTGPTGPSDVQVNGRLRTNSLMLRHAAARTGAGILLAPEFLVADDLASGRLVRVLPDYTPEEQRLDAVCPADRAAIPRLDRLIAFLAERLETQPVRRRPAG